MRRSESKDSRNVSPQARVWPISSPAPTRSSAAETGRKGSSIPRRLDPPASTVSAPGSAPALARTLPTKSAHVHSHLLWASGFPICNGLKADLVLELGINLKALFGPWMRLLGLSCYSRDGGEPWGSLPKQGSLLGRGSDGRGEARSRGNRDVQCSH